MKESIKKKLFREFLKKEKLEPLSFNMKYYYNAKRYLSKKRDISVNHMEFLLWAYDLEFFTIRHAINEFHRFPLDVENKYIYVLKREGWLIKYHDAFHMRKDFAQRMLNDGKGYSRMRYALSANARRLIKELEKITNTAVTMRGVDILKYE